MHRVLIFEDQTSAGNANAQTVTHYKCTEPYIANAQQPGTIANAQTPVAIANAQSPYIANAQQPARQPGNAQQPYPYIANAQSPYIANSQTPFTYQAQGRTPVARWDGVLSQQCTTPVSS